MSYSYERVERRTTTNPGRASSSYGHSGRRSVLGYWLPLALTVTAATVGLVAWVWSERKDDEDDSSVDEQYNSGSMPPQSGNMQMSGGLPPGQGPGFQGGPPQGPGMPPQSGYDMGAPPMQGGFVGGPPPGPGGFGPGGPMQGPPSQGGFRSVGGDQGASTGVDVVQSQTESTWASRMTNAVGLGNNDTANWGAKNLAAGVAAAGAMVGIGSMVGGNQQQQQQQQPLQSSDYYDDRRTTTTTTEQISTEQVSMQDISQREIEPKMGVKRSGTADEFFSGAVQLPKRTSLRAVKRKTVAIVVSAVEHHEDMGDMDVGDHASILSHLPSSIDTSTTRIFVLIYAPSLQTHPISAVAATKSMTSSYSNISQTDFRSSNPISAQQTPGDFPGDDYTGNQSRSPTLTNLDPQPLSTTSSNNNSQPVPNLPTSPNPINVNTTTLHATLHNQALPLVASDSETQILPFTTPRGHLHLLRSLGPEIAYIQESLTNSSPDDIEGSIVKELQGWVRNVVVVIGDEGGHGGLVDSDDEGDGAQVGKGGEGMGGGKWWQREERTGVGRGVSVVESVKIGDDWRRRVDGVE